MAHFLQAPITLLKSPPPSLEKKVAAILMRPGTYNIFDQKRYAVRVAVGNSVFKGQQARLIAQWGGDEFGNRLDVTAENTHIIEVTPLSNGPIGPHLWAYLLEAKPGVKGGSTQLFAKTADGRDYTTPLKIEVIPDIAPPALAATTPDATRRAIINECRSQSLNLPTQIAYVLATVEWETAGTWRPLREGIHSSARAERFRRTLRYYPYYGRGFVQLTHLGNYAKFSRPGVDLVHDPDLAMHGDIALKVLVEGMRDGAFGQRLDRHINRAKTDFLHARRAVNVMDHAAEIAKLAQGWLTKLNQIP